MSADVSETYWIVAKVVGDRCQTTAELIPVDWFKDNPEFKRLNEDDNYDGDLPEEFLDATPGEAGADFVEQSGCMTIELTEGLRLSPRQNVKITIEPLP